MSSLFCKDDIVADVPCHDLVLGGGAPVYERNIKNLNIFQNGKNLILTVLFSPIT